MDASIRRHSPQDLQSFLNLWLLCRLKSRNPRVSRERKWSLHDKRFAPEDKRSSILTNSSSLSVALGTADVRPALRFVAAIVYRQRNILKPQILHFKTTSHFITQLFLHWQKKDTNYFGVICYILQKISGSHSGWRG